MKCECGFLFVRIERLTFFTIKCIFSLTLIAEWIVENQFSIFGLSMQPSFSTLSASVLSLSRLAQSLLA